MDPSIMKLLEEDEDESMHSGADVDALSAALNRDIGGDLAAINPPSESDAGIFMQGSNSALKEVLENWEASTEVGNDQQIQQKEQKQPLQSSKHLSGELIQPGSVAQPRDKQVHNRAEHDQPPLQQKASNSDNLHQQSETSSLQFIEKEQMKKPDQNAICDPNKVEGPKHEFSQHSENQHQQKIGQHSISQQITSANLANMVSQKSENQPQQMVQQSNNQQISTGNQPNMAASRSKAVASIPFQMLVPILMAHLDKDRSMQLQSTFGKLRNNEVSKEDFLRVIKNIVGDQMLKQAAQKVQMQLQTQASRNAQANTNPFLLQAQASSQQLSSSSAQQLTGPQSCPALHSGPSSQNVKFTGSPNRQPYAPPKVQPGTDLAAPNTINLKSREVENRSDGKGAHSPQSYTSNTNITNPERDASIVSQAVNKQQHTQLQQTSFPKSGSTSISSHAYPRPSMGLSTSLRPESLDSNTRQVSASQGAVSTRQTHPMGVMNAPRYEQSSANETKRQKTGTMTSSSASQQNTVMWQTANKELKDSAFPSMTYVKQEIIDQTSEPPNKSNFASSESTSLGSARVNQRNSALESSRMMATAQGSLPNQSDQTVHNQIPSATTLAGANTKSLLKKPSVGQKKPFEALGSSPPMPSKKQKTSGTSLDQSIEQLNDVTAVSGVNIREEEEQLLSGKDESRASEATRRIVQEEEERLLLQKTPLQKKLSIIMLKCGLNHIGGDVERCLSLCVEERLKGLISYLIRLSKQRIDIEKSRHGLVITSDVRHQILMMNQKAKEEWDKKKAEESEKLRKVNDIDGNMGVDAEKEKEDGRSKNKGNKDEDDKMRTNAANVAARAAVGGDDMLSKWQLMAEQARQKREGFDGASISQLGKAGSKSFLAGRGSREKRESEKKGGTRKFGRKNTLESHPKVARNVSVKDVIAALEREPQMSRSPLVYRLYEKLSKNSSG
ncbi:transcription initiation factor TFIID subunit 4b-like isoform X2 [Canna indica]|uniref:Transcription initiation factor TFIID subunit 4b-like isoform X2 n=1 Tax=Canna indica TaxID=4628 RepID=A0AAQ3L2E0_9LILI|nr:transcription initiation factor TFIID subunit 4b-like isoform X2 [Canna indica]